MKLPETKSEAGDPDPDPACCRRGNDTMEIPLHGRIAAGTPIEALQGTESFAVPAALLGPGEHYALEVSGDSMVDEGILDGDFALIRKVDTARDGEIVVALIDDEEATLKTFRREGRMIRLDPANSRYEPQRYEEDRVRSRAALPGSSGDTRLAEPLSDLETSVDHRAVHEDEAGDDPKSFTRMFLDHSMSAKSKKIGTVCEGICKKFGNRRRPAGKAEERLPQRRLIEPEPGSNPADATHGGSWACSALRSFSNPPEPRKSAPSNSSEHAVEEALPLC